jgi:hypothetical protein
MEFDENGLLPPVCIPINIDAFILNEKVCDTGLTRIAPITQPDYRGLRADNAEIQHDVLPHVDVRYSQPSAINPRISNVEAANPVDTSATTPPLEDVPATPLVRLNRVGAYVHWSLPRGYRAAVSSADSVNEGNQPSTGANLSSSPEFRLVPNRWLVFRQNVSTVPTAPTSRTQSPFGTAWIVESDRLWEVSELGPTVDVEADASPYVSYTKGDETDADALNYLAGVFIGAKYSLMPPAQPTPWSEKGKTVPRVPLTTMNASNFCFADNAVHNPNVFSMVDNFHYEDEKGLTQTFTSVTCNYYVLGWHASSDDDPLHPSCEGLRGPIIDRLKALFCNLIVTPSETDIGEPQSKLPSRVLCYGAILGVKFDRNAKPNTPSDKFASLFTSAVNMEPVSVGTTPLDAMLTFLQAHSANEEDFFSTGASLVAKDILALRELLLAAEDSYNTRSKAADLVYADNFASTAGGRMWHFAGKASGPGEPPAQPSSVRDSAGFSQVDYLNQVNDLQLQFDAANRLLVQVRWGLFAVWWDYVSDPLNGDAARVASYKARLVDLRTQASTLQKLIGEPLTGLADKIEHIVRQRHRIGPVFRAKVPATPVPLTPYQQRKDPTICIAGMDSGWPTQYLFYVPVRFYNDFIVPTTTSTTVTPAANLHIGETQLSLQSLLANPIASAAPAASTTTASSSPFSDPASDTSLRAAMAHMLQYMLAMGNQAREIGFKIWTGQPWCPLYIEWEATYVHIPFEKWSVSLLSSPVAASNYKQVRYGVQEALYSDPTITADTRSVSGRIILTPQPTVNLQALVGAVLDRAGTPQPADMSKPDLLAKIANLNFTSAELSGLTGNLLTLADGAHVQPSLFIPGSTTPVPLAAALVAGEPIGFTAADLALIGDQSGLTPYGSLGDFSTALKDPFKPVTHGQFRFTKLNIVDKFGQVISGIQPGSSLETGTTGAVTDGLHPCLGDQVCPGLVGDGTSHLNTVTPLTAADPALPGGYPLCPWVQLTPAINQPARLNVSFVEPASATSGGASPSAGWKTTNDWEQPVWAWVVVNYADYGLQFFTADGTFYVEMNLGGPTGSITGPRWLPFDPPKNGTGAADPVTGLPLVSPQLVQLIGELTADAAYLSSFWNMITQAVAKMPYAPADYAAYASAIVGKPLALVNVGLSLELATAPLSSQSTLPPPAAKSPDLLGYKFPIKIGDIERPYDGVVGYFDTTGGVTAWKKLYTYFVSPPSQPLLAGDPRSLIEPASFPTLSPFFADPAGSLVNGSYAATLASKMMVKTMLVDPYTPMHVYSPILPIVSLQLPAWTVQVALQKMSTYNISYVIPSTSLPWSVSDTD